MYSFTAVLTKSTVDLLDHSVGAVFSHWQLYVLLAASAVGLLLNQSAFQAGHVAASLPAISVTNPVLASTFGVLMFGETLDATGPLAVSVTIAAIVAMMIGTITLARSPLVAARRRLSGARPHQPVMSTRDVVGEQIHEQPVVPGAIAAALVLAHHADGLEADLLVAADRAGVARRGVDGHPVVAAVVDEVRASVRTASVPSPFPCQRSCRATSMDVCR